jgi:MFS family permease
MNAPVSSQTTPQEHILPIQSGAVVTNNVSRCRQYYFKKRRGLASGIVYAGGGLGGTGIAFLMNAINQILGIEWTFRVTGLSMLATGMPMAMLLKDRGGPPPVRAWVEWQHPLFLPLLLRPHRHNSASITHHVIGEPSSKTKLIHTSRNLFRDSRFTLLFLCGLIATFPLFVPVFFIPLYAESFGIPALGGAGLFAAFQFASFFGRLGGGALADALGALNTLILSLVLNAVSMLCIWPFSTSLGPLAVFVILNGAGNRTFFATVLTVVANIFGSARVSVAMGMVVTAWTGGYLLSSPIAGFFLGATGSILDVKSYLPCILYAGGLSALALVLCLMAQFKISKRLTYAV